MNLHRAAYVKYAEFIPCELLLIIAGGYLVTLTSCQMLTTVAKSASKQKKNNFSIRRKDQTK